MGYESFPGGNTDADNAELDKSNNNEENGNPEAWDIASRMAKRASDLAIKQMLEASKKTAMQQKDRDQEFRDAIDASINNFKAGQATFDSPSEPTQEIREPIQPDSIEEPTTPPTISETPSGIFGQGSSSGILGPNWHKEVAERQEKLDAIKNKAESLAKPANDSQANAGPDSTNNPN